MKRFLTAAYVMNFAVGTTLSLRGNLPARPLGVSTGLGVRMDSVLGFGTALSAPWPMIALLLRSWHRPDAPRLLWLLFLVGALSEPITLEGITGGTSRAESIVVGVNVLAPLAMFLSPSTSQVTE